MKNVFPLIFSLCVLIFHYFILISIQIRQISALQQIITVLNIMHSVRTVLFVLTILLLCYAEVIIMDNDQNILENNIKQQASKTGFTTQTFQQNQNINQGDNIDLYLADETSTSENILNSTGVQDTKKTTISIGQFLKNNNNNDNQITNPSQNIDQNTDNTSNQNDTINYEQYLKKYKPEKYKKLNQFKNQNQYNQYLLGRSIYIRNIRYINKFNQDPKNTYKMGVNSYTDIDQIKFKQSFTISVNKQALIIKNGPLDWPQDQFQAKTESQRSFALLPIAFKPRAPSPEQNIPIDQLRKFPVSVRLSLYTIPEKVILDWRNISGKVNFQGLCNACYAFSATDSLYTTLRIRNKTTQTFSTQQIISCIKEHADRSDGCAGGLPQQVFYYIQNEGIGLEKDYPYSNDTLLNNKTGACNKKLLGKPEYLKNKYKIYNYNSVELGDCHEVANLLKNTSLTGVLAGDKGLQFYQEGVFENQDKISQLNQLDHAVAIVGFDHTKRAFIIKNSWDTSWGLNGFAYVHMNTGICASVFYPILN